MKNNIKVGKHLITDRTGGKTTLFDIERSTFYSFNKTGTYIFDLLKKGKDKKAIAKALTEKFEVTGPRAAKDVNDFLDVLSKNGISYPSEQKKRKKSPARPKRPKA